MKQNSQLSLGLYEKYGAVLLRYTMNKKQTPEDEAMKFTVRPAHDADVFRDIARISEQHRLDKADKCIPAGTICKIILTDTGKHCYAMVRGENAKSEDDRIIRIDDYVRDKLDVHVGDIVPLSLNKANFIGELIWSWTASDPAYRVTARLGVISFILGLIGLILGIKGCV